MLAVAAWMRYVGGVDERGDPIEVKDPMASRLRALSDAGSTSRDKVANLLSVEEIFARGLADRMQDHVTAAYSTLVESGARSAVCALVEQR